MVPLYLNLAVSWFDLVHHYNLCGVLCVCAWVGGLFFTLTEQASIIPSNVQQYFGEIKNELFF